VDIKYAALSRGFFKHTTKPGLIKEVSLIDYLPKAYNRSKLIKQIAYCLVTSIEERIYKEEYRVAYYSCSIVDWKFKVVYPKVKHFKSLKDLLIIDVSILETNRDIVFSEFTWFKEDLIKELNEYGK